MNTGLPHGTMDINAGHIPGELTNTGRHISSFMSDSYDFLHAVVFGYNISSCSV